MSKSIKTIERDDWGIKGIKGKAVVSSRVIAEKFGKQHKDVLEAIRKSVEDIENVAADFSATNFITAEYTNRGKKYPEFLLTKDGFVYIAMGFGGSKAAKFKVEYIERFNKMEDYIYNRGEAKDEYKMLMDSVADNASNKWACPTEADMINKIVLGKKAKQYREENNIPTKETRAYITAEEIESINKLQKMDYALVEMGASYYERKEKLAKYFVDKLAPKLGLLND